MKCAIMQPTYLPWIGYFSLINSVDHFVFLDDVQLTKQSWQTRNRILQDGSVFWLSLNINSKSDTLIKDVQFSNNFWRAKHIRTIRHSYSNCSYFHELEDILRCIDNDNNNLSEFNIAIIKSIVNILDIDVNFHVSSKMNVFGQRTERLAYITKKLGCNTYVATAGSLDYMEVDGLSAFGDISIKAFNYNIVPYSQKKTLNFVPNLSIIDAIANCGLRNVKDILKEYENVCIDQ